MTFRPLPLLLSATLAVTLQAGESDPANPSAPIPADAIWDANAWEPGSADSFWTKSTPSVVRLSPPRPNRRASTDAAARLTTPPRPFSRRRTGK